MRYLYLLYILKDKHQWDICIYIYHILKDKHQWDIEGTDSCVAVFSESQCQFLKKRENQKNYNFIIIFF